MKTAWLCCLVCLPLKLIHVTSPFGWRIHPLTGRLAMHDGVDLRAARDTVYAVFDGEITHLGNDRLIGVNLQLLRGQLTAIYGHLSTVLVTEGQIVAAGDPVAISGSTGAVTAAHLHLAIHYGKCPLDPLKFLYQTILKLNENE